MKKLIVLILPFLLVSCVSTLRYSNENKSTRSSELKEELSSRKDIKNHERAEVLETSVETASYYADAFNGKTTANGEIFDMYDLTAAHVSYPFNTICRVTNPKNRKSVIVRINDRKPNTNNRTLDLSLKAAQELGMIEDGVTDVKVDILEWGDE